MSAQGNYLKVIADAIREKAGTTDSIPANMFASRILALPTGGGGSGGGCIEVLEPLDPNKLDFSGSMLLADYTDAIPAPLQIQVLEGYQ